MLLGIALMIVATLAWEFTIGVYWNRPMEWMKVGWHTLSTVAALVATQAIIWSLHRFRWIRIVALVGAMYAFLYVCLVGQLWKFSGGAWLWFGGLSLVIPVAILGAVAGVGRDRQGLWKGWTGKLLEYLLDLVPRRSDAFGSPASAQLWFEWRRKGLFFALAFATIIALCVFTYPLSAALYLGPTETLLNFSGPFIGMIFIAGAIGTSVAKSDAWSRELDVHPVVATRPLGTGSLVLAKMKAAAAVTIAGWLFFLVLLWPVIAITSHLDWPSEQALRFWQDFSANYPKFWRWLTNPIVILALFAATWHTTVQSLSVVLSGDKRRIVFSTWQSVIVISIVVACTLWLYRHPTWVEPFSEFLPWFIAVMMFLKGWRTVRAFSALKPLVTQRQAFFFFALWTLTALLVLAAGTYAHALHGLPPSILWLLVLWQFFPAGEIPSCVVALASNRHR
jgi:hypothetical protein